MVSLAGVPNFRSLGGTPVAGGVVRDGSLFRSGALLELNADDAQALARVGLRTIIDLRRDSEREAEPNCLPPEGDCRTIDFNMADALSGGSNADYLGVLVQSPSARGAHAAMTKLYSALPSAVHGSLMMVFDALGREDAAPALIQCTAGKDRTGVFCAILLHALGASRSTIIDDYLASQGRHPAFRLEVVTRSIARRTGIKDCTEIAAVFMGVERDFLNGTLDAIDEGWGGLDAYIASAGVTDAMLGRLRQIYVDRDD